ncbi:hypothetical protein BpHYR1_008164 [Brachionus plicatilis]|uniref:Uncharacterized protein n=1 Tax=Brachionus plicatilis TaxID=10195 RepID=A0A3M7PRI2_BRAPC|nr:hypothetical protein BpHYR1_008164 [Brachionus plicatilis]
MTLRVDLNNARLGHQVKCQLRIDTLINVKRFYLIKFASDRLVLGQCKLNIRLVIETRCIVIQVKERELNFFFGANNWIKGVVGANLDSNCGADGWQVTIQIGAFCFVNFRLATLCINLKSECIQV